MRNAGPRWSLPTFGLPRFFTFFPSPSSCDSCTRKLFSSTHLHFCCLLNKDQCHSALTAGAPTRLPWPSGEQIQNPSIVLRRGGWGDGGRRVEPALCPSQRRQKQQVVGILRFFYPHYDPTLAPENPGLRRSRCARHLCQPDSKVSVRRQRLLMNQKPASCANPPPTVVKGQLMNLVSVSLSV